MNNVALFPRSPSNCRTAPRRSTATRCTAHAHSFRHHGSKPKLSLVPSSDDEPRRSNYSTADHPPQSAASLVVPRCRCRKRRHQTLCHTELTTAKQCQPPRSAACSQTTTMKQPLVVTITARRQKRELVNPLEAHPPARSHTTLGRRRPGWVWSQGATPSRRSQLQ